MNKKKLLKWGLYSAVGDAREELVANNFLKRGFTVKESTFSEDVNSKIDLIVQKNNGPVMYVQVKGFHENWKNDNFDKLISEALKDNAIPLIARVNKNNRIFFWNPIKK